MDLDRFAKRMAEISVGIETEVDKVVRKVALATDQAVVMGTPVDTGRARANWITALDAASPAVTDAVGASAALEQAASVISTYDGDRNTAIHITNNLPYIERLNDGYSAQAPAGYVEAGLQAGVAVVKGAKIII